ncbi:MAG TPA: hypothetical protein PLC76_13565 [Saprospiraceae bacterium]|jgi:hypothetical protein|nr:hypothetical protein [Saprospiraceae bacterium]HRP85743.1 hypothetical protein [Saprospiraceae bacterium]
MKYLVYSIFFAFSLLQSCTTSKPIADRIESFDYNERSVIVNPSYTKVLNPVGVSALIGGTIAGSYLGNKYSPFDESYKINRNIDPYGLALGALSGYSITYLLIRATGLGKTFQATDKGKWLNQTKSNLRLISSTNNTINVIKSNIEPNYSIREYNDLIQFFDLFRNSSYNDKVLKEALNIPLTSEQLDYIITNLIDNSEIKLLYKQRYLTSSKSIDELLIAVERYGNCNLEIEVIAKNLVKTETDFLTFLTYFPHSNFIEEIIDVVKNELSFKTLQSIIETNISQPYINKLVSVLFSKIDDLAALRAYSKKYQNYITKKEIDILAWNLAKSSHENAKELISLFPKSPFIIHEVIDFQEGEYYVGESINNVPNGFGYKLYTNHPNNYYKGSWSKGMKNGFGEEYTQYVDNDFTLYKGDYVNNEREGNATINRGNKFTYVGPVVDGIPEGQGTLTYSSGEILSYKGAFKNGQFNGHGRLEFPQNEWLEGNFKDGFVHGLATRRINTGHRVTGEYRNGKGVGIHKYTKYILGGLVEQEAGTVDFGNGDEEISVTETYNWNDNVKNNSVNENEQTISKEENEEPVIDYESIEHPGVKKVGEWEFAGGGIVETRYYSCQIEFNDWISGKLFKYEDKHTYIISSLGIRDYEYSSYDNAIKALYIYKKYGVIIKTGRIN